MEARWHSGSRDKQNNTKKAQSGSGQAFYLLMYFTYFQLVNITY